MGVVVGYGGCSEVMKGCGEALSKTVQMPEVIVHLLTIQAINQF